MKIKATTPCYKFRDATPEEQIAKIKEELAEVEAAYTEFKKSAAGFLWQLGCALAEVTVEWQIWR